MLLIKLNFFTKNILVSISVSISNLRSRNFSVSILVLVSKKFYGLGLGLGLESCGLDYITDMFCWFYKTCLSYQIYFIRLNFKSLMRSLDLRIVEYDAQAIVNKVLVVFLLMPINF